ncbi:MAG TPA: HAD-IA family hydrolase [Candidatus Binataceae bacterium]|nr:HAD-IA family hydrolase [Candidatus Binataceae bacterium]
MIRAVFFDAAGTLFDSREPIGRTYARVARAHGLDAPEEAVADAFRRAFQDAPELAFGRGHSSAELRRLERNWWRERVAETFAPLGQFPDFDAYFDALFAYFAEPAHWHVFPEGEPALRRLKECGVKLGVISNFDYRVYRILEGLGLAQHFDSITISSEAGRAKPHREIFEVAMSRQGVAPAEAMHVGDSERLDFSAALGAGMAAVLIDRENGLDEVETTGEAAARVSSLADLPELCQLFRSA